MIVLLWLACGGGDADDSGAPTDTIDHALATCLADPPTTWSGTRAHAWRVARNPRASEMGPSQWSSRSRATCSNSPRWPTWWR